MAPVHCEQRGFRGVLRELPAGTLQPRGSRGGILRVHPWVLPLHHGLQETEKITNRVELGKQMSALMIIGLLFLFLFSKLNVVHGKANSFSRLTKRAAFRF